MTKNHSRKRLVFNTIKSKLLLSYFLVVLIPVLVGTYLPFNNTQKTVVRETEDSFRFSLNQMVDAIKYRMVKYNRLSMKLSGDYQLMRLITDDYRGRTY